MQSYLLDDNKLQVGFENEYQRDIEQMIDPSYEMTTLICTLFISFFTHPNAIVIDVFELQITRQIGSDFRPLLDQPLQALQTTKPFVYLPVCSNRHWILLRFEVSSGILLIFNSLLGVEMSLAVNGIAECLRLAYNKCVQIENRECPQQLNGTDCGFFAMIFLLRRAKPAVYTLVNFKINFKN